MEWETFQRDKVVMFFGVRNFFKKGGIQVPEAKAILAL